MLEPAASSQPVATPTIPVTKPFVGLVRLKPSSTEVYVNSKDGFKEVCNFIFTVAGTKVVFFSPTYVCKY